MIELTSRPRFNKLALSELHLDRVNQPGVAMRATFVLLRGNNVVAETKMVGGDLDSDEIQEALGKLLDVLERKAAKELYETVDQQPKEEGDASEPKGLADAVEEASQI